MHEITRSPETLATLETESTESILSEFTRLLYRVANDLPVPAPDSARTSGFSQSPVDPTGSD